MLAVVAFGFPLYTIRNLTQMTEQRGLFPVVTDACKLIGPNGAVVIPAETTQPQSIVYLADPQTLRSFCNVPVVVMVGPPRPALLRTLASEWAAKGRRLYLVSEFEAPIRREFPRAQVRPTVVGQELHLLAPTLLHRPDHYTADQFHIAARVPAHGRRRPPGARGALTRATASEARVSDTGAFRRYAPPPVPKRGKPVECRR